MLTVRMGETRRRKPWCHELSSRFHDGATQVLVVDEEGRLAGMVQPADLLVELAPGLQEGRGGACDAGAPGRQAAVP